jgi:hypothetical protein
MGGDRQAERLTIAQAAREWRRSNEEAKVVLRSLDRSQWIEIHYEQLCNDPLAELNRAFSLLECEPLGKLPTMDNCSRHVVGNGMRLDTDWKITLDERWKEVLTDEQLRQFDAVAGDLNARYGYPPFTGRSSP